MLSDNRRTRTGEDHGGIEDQRSVLRVRARGKEEQAPRDGITVGILGAVIGGALGYIITRNINVVENAIRVVLGLNLWSSSVYMFDKIPNEMNWGWALTFMGLAVVAAALGALTPAIVAALTKPVEVLRYD